MRTKKAIRAEVLKTREQFDTDTLKQKSENICNKFIELFSGYDSYLLYQSIKSEVDVSSIVNTLYKGGGSIYLPEVFSSEMTFRLYEGFEKLRYDQFGIACASGERLGKDIVDVAVIPGVAFDAQFGRLGYGKGYYDKFLSKQKVLLKVGLAYDFQIVESTCREPHDILMDIIVTETKIYRRSQ